MSSCSRRRRAGALIVLLTLAACAAPAPRAISSTRRVSAPPPALMPAPAVAAPSSAPSPQRPAVQPRFAAALQLLKGGDLEGAGKAFAALNRDYPQLSGPLTDLGIVYARNRQNDLAIASFARAATINPSNVVALNWLGTLCRERGDYTRAENAYRRALMVDPRYAAARLNLAVLYDLNLRRPQQALAEYREYQKLAPDPNPMVAVWIRQLESAGGSAVASAEAP